MLEDINFEVVGNLDDVKGGWPPGDRGESNCDCSDYCACNIQGENETSTSNSTDSAEYV